MVSPAQYENPPANVLMLTPVFLLMTVVLGLSAKGALRSALAKKMTELK